MLVQALDINLYQKGLENKLDIILANADYEITKSDVRHEIRSNHKMTEKVLRELESEGLIELVKKERTTLVKITKKRCASYKTVESVLFGSLQRPDRGSLQICRTAEMVYGSKSERGAIIGMKS